MRHDSAAGAASSLTRRAVLIGGVVGVAGVLLVHGRATGVKEHDARAAQSDPVTERMIENSCAL